MSLTHNCVISQSKRSQLHKQTGEGKKKKINVGVGVYCSAIYFTMQFCFYHRTLKKEVSLLEISIGSHRMAITQSKYVLLTVDMSVRLNHS